jgi:hypothetical protein
MVNIDKIKNMDIEELTGFLLSVEHNYYDFTYYDEVKKWLLREDKDEK